MLCSWIRKLGVAKPTCRHAARAIGPSGQCGASWTSYTSGHRRDPAYLRDPARMRDVGLGNSDPGLEHGQEVLSAVQPLPRGDRDGCRLSQLADQVRVLRDDRLLDEEGAQRLQQRGQPTGVGQGQSAVEVDGHIPVGPQHLARRGHAPEHGVDLSDGAQRAHRARGIHLSPRSVRRPSEPGWPQ
jgi:hypothetical protein